MNIVAFIPARLGSKRTSKKNLQKILGVPLVLWAANNLNRVIPKKKIYIDSNADEILDLAKKHGFNTLKRPEELSTNATNGNEFMIWEASQVKADIYIQHLPPMIFLKETTIKLAIDKVLNQGFDSSFGAYKERFYTWGKLKPNYDLKNIPNSFTLPEVTIEGMGLYVIKHDALFNSKTRIGNNFSIVELDKYETMDIDYPQDLEFARTLASGLGYDSNYTKGIKQYLPKAKNIKLVVLDVDGVLTDGGMYYSNSGDELKKFNTKDGRALLMLAKNNIQVGFLSSGINNSLIKKRASHLNVKFVKTGTESKKTVLIKWCKELNIQIDNVAYIGDDINDLDIIKYVKFSACPSDAIESIKKHSTIILERKGGEGCVREFVDNYIL